MKHIFIYCSYIYVYVYNVIIMCIEWVLKLYMLLVMLLCQTDTASVLSEAIEYIKFLHEQVTVSPITYTH